jgi:LPS-assembly lipoprotein
MSSSDPKLFPSRILSTRIVRFIVAIAGAVILAACTVQPLYGPSPAGSAVSTALARIVIDPVDNRVGQELRNKLIFDLGGSTTAPVYRMKLVVSSAESALGVTPVEAAPAYSLTVSATYEVTNIGTGDIVLRGTSRGTASFDRVSQIYANTRARLDAEDRAAGLAADDIRVRLAGAASKGTL